MTEPVIPSKASDYCVKIKVENLQPNTRYYYQLIIGGEKDKYRAGKPADSILTAPAVGEKAKFRVAFGSCARWQKTRRQRIWPVVERYNPTLFFWLGDNVYADTLDPEILAEELTRQREVPGLPTLLATIPQFAIWDDHDFGLNNHDRSNPIKSQVLEIWKRYWPNPDFGTSDTDGVFFKYGYGGVDFFFLDGRYHRDPNKQADGPGKTMLGTEQIEWLKKELIASSAPFKVLISGSVWTTDKGEGGDAWSSYRHERDALFDWIMNQKIEGVILLSGDTHTGELNVAPWSEKGGYDLYDLIASPLAQEPDNDWLFRNVEQRIRLPYNMGENFGLIDFDLTQRDPKLTFRLIGTESKAVWDVFEIHASELRPGISSWRSKQSEDAANWMNYLRD